MNAERYSIVFSSRTGNTKMLADALREVLPEEARDYFGPCGPEIPQSETLYVGFWTDRGNANEGGAGAAESAAESADIPVRNGGLRRRQRRISGRCSPASGPSVDGSNTVVGTFMCQGKMPQSVKARYEKMREQPNHADNLDALIENFDRALSHPDADDLDRLRNAVR